MTQRDNFAMLLSRAIELQGHIESLDKITRRVVDGQLRTFNTSLDSVHFELTALISLCEETIKAFDEAAKVG